MLPDGAMLLQDGATGIAVHPADCMEGLPREVLPRGGSCVKRHVFVFVQGEA